MAKARARAAKPQAQAAQPRVQRARQAPAAPVDPAADARGRRHLLVIRGIGLAQAAVGAGMFANLALGGPLAVTIACTVAFFALAALRLYLTLRWHR